jgi:hypothetical protein
MTTAAFTEWLPEYEERRLGLEHRLVARGVSIIRSKKGPDFLLKNGPKPQLRRRRIAQRTEVFDCERMSDGRSSK